ncbi:MAG: low molecular weight protein arginine phosphatase [Anaerolineae bacterium]
MKRVLFVCTANICRSPMAMGLLRQRLAEDGLADEVQVTSAGVYGMDGEAASATGVKLLAERGVDIAAHRAHTLSEQEMTDTDLVLVMEESHRRSMFYNYPHLLNKVFLVSEMAGEYHDIADPYRKPVETYIACVDELTRLINDGYAKILKRLDITVPKRP